ncbi:MAG: ankyrin repeat domain-containing protein [Acidobacteria bacterium]|nr:ankyrin repeat domain-containing protein [Acidobacteriota bacterium]MCA1640586.1 ankyrin repeat domain-containing protein [Acidobacteriota bacterium]
MTRKLCLLLALALALPLTIAAQDKQKLNEDLWEAVRHGDATTVKALLDRGADVNAPGRYQMTPLFKASERGDAGIVRLLLERGADVTVRDTFYKATAMTWALNKSHVEVVRALIEKGAPGVEDVLAQGAGSGNAELVKIALAKGGLSADALSAALGAATREKHAAVADLLKAAGAIPPPEANFEVDAETLKSYVGTYHPERGSDIGVAVNKDGKLTIIAGETFVLGAFDKVTFRPLAFDGVKITFVVEGGKVTGFNFKQGPNTQFFKRVEVK